MVQVNHYLPSLGGGTSGSSTWFDLGDLEGVLREVRKSLERLEPGERLIITLEGD